MRNCRGQACLCHEFSGRAVVKQTLMARFIGALRDRTGSLGRLCPDSRKSDGRAAPAEAVHAVAYLTQPVEQAQHGLTGGGLKASAAAWEINPNCKRWVLLVRLKAPRCLESSVFHAHLQDMPQCFGDTSQVVGELCGLFLLCNGRPGIASWTCLTSGRSGLVVFTRLCWATGTRHASERL